jgi:multiple sugar transport system permease protein
VSQRIGAGHQGRLGQLLIHATLLVGGLIFLFPLYWMLITSLKAPAQVMVHPPDFVPRPIHWQSYPDAFSRIPFLLFARNTAIIAVLTVFGTVLSCSVVAYPFAKLRFPGRSFLFILLLSTVMLPDIVRLVPTFLLFKQFGWVNTLYPLIVPNFFGNAFYIFLIRQYFLSIPNELIDAARIDGASEWRILFGVVIPLSRPVLVVTVIFSFQSAWNDFLWPLVFLKEMEVRTLTLGLYTFRAIPTMGETFFNELMAAATMVTVPMIVLFVLFQKYFVNGIALGSAGIKG